MLKKIFAILFLFILSSSLYLLTVKGIKGNITGSQIKNNLDQATMPLELSPERGRFVLTMSLVENGTFSLSPELTEAAAPDVGFHEGKFYIFFPPGISLMAVPLYILGKQYNLSQVAAFTTISFFASLNIILVFLIAKEILRLRWFAAILAAVIFGFATTSWSYAISLYQHHVSLFLLLSSFYAVWRFKKTKQLGLLWSAYIWFCYGWGIWIDYPNAILLAPVMFYFLISSLKIEKLKQKIVFALSPSFLMGIILFLLLVGLHGYYNQINFGSWKKLSGGIMSYKQYQDSYVKKTVKNNKTSKEPVSQERNVVGFFKEENFPKGFAILTASPDRGISLYSPILLLAIFGLFTIVKRINTETGILLAVLGVNFLLYSSWGDPWGGWAYGPRYLIFSMAVMSMLVGVWLNNSKREFLSRFLTFILFAYSSFIALLGALTTSQIPPKIEADFLKMKYNFLLNWDYFLDGKSSSFIFNEYAVKQWSLQQYFLLIYYVLIFIVFVVLFVSPFFESRNEH